MTDGRMIFDAGNIAIECQQTLDDEGSYAVGNVRMNADQSYAEMLVSYDGLEYLLSVAATRTNAP